MSSLEQRENATTTNNHVDGGYSHRLIPRHLLQGRNLGDILYLTAERYVQTIPIDDPRMDYLLNVWDTTSRQAPAATDPAAARSGPDPTNQKGPWGRS